MNGLQTRVEESAYGSSPSTGSSDGYSQSLPEIVPAAKGAVEYDSPVRRRVKKHKDVTNNKTVFL